MICSQTGHARKWAPAPPRPAACAWPDRKRLWKLDTLDPKILAGDQAAIGRFVDFATPIVQARVARKLAPSERALSGDLRQDVLDVTQDIFVYLFSDGAKALRRWDPAQGLSLANFIGLIAERRTISALRSGRSNPWREQAAGDDYDHRDAAAGVERAVAEEDQFRRLLAAMREALSEQGWHLFQLLYVQELSVEAVQAETGLKPDAIYAWRSRLRRAAKKQFALLQPDEPVESRRTGQ